MKSLIIPICDTARIDAALEPEIFSAIQRVMQSGQYIKGPHLDRFEMLFAQYLGTKHCIGVNSGTDALKLSLRAFGIKPGDEVIVPAMTFSATAQAAAAIGAKVVFVDIKGDGTDCIDESKITRAITERTKAIVPVHLHGYMCNMNEILAIANRYNLAVLEDCAQATGLGVEMIDHSSGSIKYFRAGTLGHAGAFSFFPTKNLGCLGDGGCVVTDSDEIAQEIRDYREHGGPKNNPTYVGENSRLDAIQAAVLTEKLPHLDTWNAERRAIAKRYDELLKSAIKSKQKLSKLFLNFKISPGFLVNSISLPPIYENAVYHHYQMRVPCQYDQDKILLRDRLQKNLKLKWGIEAISYYPKTVSSMLPYFAEFDGDVEYINAQAQSWQGLSLPIFPGLNDVEINYVVEKLIDELDELLE